MTKKDLTPTEKSSANEHLKIDSNFLRGNLEEEIQDVASGAIPEGSTQLTKFHGTYMQDDRDVRPERRKKILDKAYSFMIRMRIPGGVVTPDQWIKVDDIATTYANNTLKITTRQTFQIHGVIKFNLKDTFQAMDAAAIDCIAACGDVNRNVMCNPNPYLSKAHAETLQLADDISMHLLPRTNAYHEIWLDGEKATPSEDEEPIYGKVYLPRKFKIVIAVPPSNDVDIYAHCLGFIAIIENDKIIGYNVTVGGGMGMTHGDTDTFPRTADVLGFCTPDQAVKVAEAVMTTQRDHGNREERKNARFKYTVERMGVDAIRKEVEERAGFKLEEAKPFKFDDNGDRYGWTKGEDGKNHLTLYIENGRLKGKQKEGVRKIAEVHDGDFRMTANQNLIIAQVSDDKKAEIEKLVKEYGLDQHDTASRMRLSSMACVALPTCGLALAESERYLPSLVDKLVEETGLAEDDIVVRMTGCPNGCARPYLAEIGFVGTGPGKYNVYLGGAYNGERLSKLHRKDQTEEEILALLKPILLSYAKDREDGERFGDFVIRTGIILETTAGNNFHKNLAI